MSIIEFFGLVGQLYAIMNPIGKLAIVGPLAVEKPSYVKKITLVVVFILTSIFALGGGLILTIFGVGLD